MKTSLPSTSCALQSDSYVSGRRVMIFTNESSRASTARKQLSRRPSPFRVKLMMAPEAQFSFEPAITVRAHAKP
jgi:hypothetical protein